METEESAFIEYYWPFYLHLSPLILLLALIVLLNLKPNRSPGAWWVLLPTLAPVIVAIGAATLIQFTFLSDFVTLFYFGLASLWLMAFKMTDLSRNDAFSSAIGITAFAGLMGIVGLSYFSFHPLMILSGMAYGLLMLLVLGAFYLAGYLCRQSYTPRRFILRLFALITVMGGGLFALLFSISMLPTILIGRADFMSFPGMFLGGIAVVLLATIGGGVLLFLLILPFVVLTFRTPFYRQRFNAIFRLPGMAFQEEAVYDNPMSGGDNL
jgi:hypothetical protein